MLSVETQEVRAQWSALLQQVQGGQRILITDHGRAIAQLVPLGRESEPARPVEQIVSDFASFRRGVAPAGPSARELIDEGRKH